MKHLILYIVLGLSTLFFTGCGEDDNGGGNNLSANPQEYGEGVEGTSKIALNGYIKFNVSDAQSLIATDELSSQTTSPSTKLISNNTEPTFYFYDENNTKSNTSNYSLKSNDNQQGKSNLFTIDEDGVAHLAINSNYDIKILYSILSKDGKYVYIALDPGYDRWGGIDWSHDTQDTRTLIAETNCSLYKVSLEDDSFGCLDSGYLATPINESFKKVMSESNIKPLQIDENGSLYYLAKTFTSNKDCYDGGYYDENGTFIESQQCNYHFNYEHNEFATLRKITTLGEKYSITPDNNQITNFKVLPNSAIVYIYRNDRFDEQGIKMYTPSSTDPTQGSTNTLSNDGNWWDGFFFTTDDVSTVIYGSSDGGWGDRGISFAQKHPVVESAKISKQLNTSLFTARNNSPTPARLMIGDDGYIYGLFVEDMGYWDNSKGMHINKYALNVYRILPFKAAPIVSVELESHDWWKVMKGIDFHIAKGYIYYVAKDKHPTGLYGDRQVIKILRMVDGAQSTLLNGKQVVDGYETWTDRYEIFNWKLVGDIIYFSGFDEANSKVVAGEIDTIKVKQGLEESEYLTTSNVASAVGASATIRDMEIVKPKAPVTDSGSAPTVTKIYTDPENLYSASIDFSKYMNNEDVSSKLSVFTYDENNEKQNVESMKLWLNKTMHMILDTDNTNSETDPLENGTKYHIEIDNEALDRWGWSLKSGMGNQDYTRMAFTTVPDKGWYGTVDERVAGITDGYVARYVSDGDFSHDSYSLVADDINQSNFKIEFSFKMKGNNYHNRLRFKVKDSKIVDWSDVNWSNQHITNGDGDKIERIEGHYEDKDSNTYKEEWRSNVRYLIDETNGIEYVWKDSYRYDSDGYRYTNHWNNQGEYVKKYDSNNTYLETYLREEPYYTDENGTKYRHESGEYRNINDFDDIIDWSDGTHYTWHDGSYIKKDTNESVENFNFWNLTEQKSGYDKNTTVEEERIDFTFLWNDSDVLTESTELKWKRETYKNVDTNETYEDWQNGWNHTITKSDYFVDNNTSWDWDGKVLDLSVESSNNVNYNYMTGSQNNRSDSWGNKNIFNLSSNDQFRNVWYKGIIKIYGSNFTFHVVNDENITHEVINETNINTQTHTDSGFYRVDMQVDDSRDIVMDNIKIELLDASGNDINNSTVVHETFDGHVQESPVTVTHTYSNN